MTKEKTAVPSLIQSLCDESVFTLPQAIGLAQSTARLDPRVRMRLLHYLLYDMDRNRGGVSSAAGRLLDVIAAISGSGSILPLLSPLLNDPDAHIRSRVALLIARGNRSAKWVERRTAEDDPRVRANAIEGLWGADLSDAQEFLLRAVSDGNQRVAGNALVGLYCAGNPECIPSFMEMAVSPRPVFRTTAAWAMGETADPRFLPLLAHMLTGSEGSTRRAVFCAITRIKQATAAAASNPPVTVSVPFVRTIPDSSRRLRITVTSPDEQPIAGLPATAFIAWEKGAAVTVYAVREQPLTSVMTVAFAIPHRLESGKDHQAACEAALLDCLKYKRASDAWVVGKYDAPFEVAKPGAEPLRLALASAEPALREAVEGPRSTAQAAAVLGDVALKLVQLLSKTPGARHLILLSEHPCGAAFANQLAEFALSAGITVNAISMNHDSLLELTCNRTFGVFCRVPSLPAIGSAVEKLYSSLVSHYELSYRLGAECDVELQPPVRIQVHSRTLTGTGTGYDNHPIHSVA